MSTRVVKLGTVCTVVSGSTPKSEVAEYWDGDVKWITPAELTEDSYIITDSVRHITSQAVHDTSLKPFPEGTVILSSRAPIGKTAIAGCEMYCNQGFKNLICSPQIDPKYLYFFLSGKTEFLNSLGRGATFKEISKAIVENIELPLPELAVQGQISLQFEYIRTLIKQYREQLHYLDQLVKSRFIEMFGNVSSSDWRTMEEICPIITDGTHQPPKFVSDGIPFLFVSNIIGNILTYNAEKFIDEQTYYELIKRTPIEIGDILLSTVGSYGHPAVVKEPTRFCFQRHIAYLKPKADMVDSDYLHGAILSSIVQAQIEEKVKGIAQKTLNLSEIRTIRVPIPEMHMQRAFAHFAAETDKSKFSLKNGGKEAAIAVKYIWESLCRGTLA